ncbi:MAG: hypothetical protein ABW318_14615, partial [Vicinamibacterales bacterium]
MHQLRFHWLIPNAVGVAFLTAAVSAQTPADPQTSRGSTGAPGRGGAAAPATAGRGAAGAAVGRGALGAATVAAPAGEDTLLFLEKWTRDPTTEPMVQKNLSNQNLRLHLYGDYLHIRKTFHPSEDY